jgi:small subunit ribosomal protein S1
MKEEISDYIDPEKEALSEGWWASVLAEDECVSSMKRQKESAPRSEQQIKAAQISDTDWDYVQGLLEQEQIITGTVVDTNKGGLLICSDKLQGFVPVSHLDDVIALEDEAVRDERLHEYLDCRLRLKVIECDPLRGRIVLSERAAQTVPGQRQKLLEELVSGEVISGRITNITDFGAFVDLGGVEGLVHISELSWGRVLHPKDYTSIGESIEVMVLQVNKEKCRVSLSLKRLQENPWIEVAEKYPSGTMLDAEITEIVKFGAFARLNDGLEGLIHITEMGIEDGSTPDSFLTPGQQVKVEVVVVDSERQRMSLRLIN